jgi:hypothetical protein
MCRIYPRRRLHICSGSPILSPSPDRGFCLLPIYDGVVTVNEDQVPVIIGLEDDGIRMSTNGTEIGEWPTGEFRIDHRGDGVYTITADNESLLFVPNRPDLFAVGLGHPLVADRGPAAKSKASIAERTTDPEVPSPKALTLALFYTLAGTTAALGLWALIRLIF